MWIKMQPFDTDIKKITIPFAQLFYLYIVYFLVFQMFLFVFASFHIESLF